MPIIGANVIKLPAPIKTLLGALKIIPEEPYWKVVERLIKEHNTNLEYQAVLKDKLPKKEVKIEKPVLVIRELKQ